MTGSLSKQAAGRWVFPALVLIVVLAGYGAATTSSTSYAAGIWIFAVVMAGWVITLCLHEFAHAAIALAGGDASVRVRGYLTLNPFRYLNAAFSIVIPLVILAIGGIPLPGGGVLIENHRLRTKWWSSLVSLGGPATNFVLGILLVYLVRALPLEGTNGDFTPNGLYQALSFLALLQFVTAILNILPIPGFDGFGIIAPYLSPATQRAIAPIRGWAPLIVFVVVFSIPNASTYLFDPAFALIDLFGNQFVHYAAAVGSGAFRFWD